MGADGHQGIELITLNKVTMEQEKAKITRQMIRDIDPGESVVFGGLDPKAVEAGKSQVYQVARLDATKYTVKGDYKRGRLTVTRLTNQGK